MNSKYGAPATLENIERAIVDLSDADWVKLRKMATGHLWGTRLEDPDALINDTIERLIAGKRTWHIDMAFVPWMDSAMRSVADDLRTRKQEKSLVLAGDLLNGCDAPDEPLDLLGEDGETPLDTLLTEEARAAAEHDLSKIEESFKDDSEVGWILLGLDEKMSAREIQAISGMTKTQYETARKRLRRECNRLFPSGRKS